MMNRFLTLNLLCLGMAIVVGSGCGKPASTVGGMTHVKALSMLYTKVSVDMGKEPADEQAFKEGIAKSGIDIKSFSVANADELFVSERDGEPLIVAYPPRPKNSDVTIYEKVGVDGKRLLAHRIGTIEEVDAAKFAELVPEPEAAK